MEHHSATFSSRSVANINSRNVICPHVFKNLKNLKRYAWAKHHVWYCCR